MFVLLTSWRINV